MSEGKDYKKKIFYSSNDIFMNLARSVYAWLNYNSSVCGEIGVQENMINQPIKAFSIFHQNDYSFKFEKQHPYLSKRCHVDFYMEMKNEDDDFKECYMEFKQAKSDTTSPGERQRIYNDIARLASIVTKKCRCFFLIFGTGYSYKNCFLNYSIEKQQRKIRQHGESEEHTSYYSQWFSFDYNNRDKLIEIRKVEFYEDFCKEYIDKSQNRQKAEPPEKVYTHLIFNGSEQNENGVGLWEILVLDK